MLHSGKLYCGAFSLSRIFQSVNTPFQIDRGIYCSVSMFSSPTLRMWNVDTLKLQTPIV